MTTMCRTADPAFFSASESRSIVVSSVRSE